MRYDDPYIATTKIMPLLNIDEIDGAKFGYCTSVNRTDYYTVKPDDTIVHSYRPMKTLTFTGAVTGTYDGSSDVEINIPLASGDTDID